MTGFDHPEKAPRTLGAVTVALTAAAGSLDAVTFFAFNEVFASTMTGNLILLGLDWDGNSALRIATVAVAAAAGAFVQLRAPDFTYLIPVAMVALVIVLMVRVTMANHGGLVQGDPQFARPVEEEAGGGPTA
ncbi:DUF1275 family protein [Pseudonocardia sediminis]|uniref:DUF1275 family protein n=1 Tax=Pseudonocardia sediminis TaxID=1397368 RepID=UPI0013EF5239|nr:DUF1275 family protein [Pseudonocardia sediminis]